MGRRKILTGFRTTIAEEQLLKRVMKKRRVRKKSDYLRGLLLIDAELQGVSIVEVDIPNWAFPIIRGMVEDRAEGREKKSNRPKRTNEHRASASS